MTEGRDTEQSWVELVRSAYPNARDDEFERTIEGIYFRRKPTEDGDWSAAWFHEHRYGWVEVHRP